MRTPRAQKRLRGLAARLAGESPRDIAAVLEDLPPEYRGEVEALLDDYRSAAPESRQEAAAISPWLQALLDEQTGGRSLKPRTRAALLAAASLATTPVKRRASALPRGWLTDRLGLMKTGAGG